MTNIVPINENYFYFAPPRRDRSFPPRSPYVEVIVEPTRFKSLAWADSRIVSRMKELAWIISTPINSVVRQNTEETTMRAKYF